MNILSYLLGKNNNHFFNSLKFQRFHEIKTKDICEVFYNKLLKNCINDNKITQLESQYLLDSKNYIYNNLNDFQKSFLAFRNKNNKKIEKNQDL